MVDGGPLLGKIFKIPIDFSENLVSPSPLLEKLWVWPPLAESLDPPLFRIHVIICNDEYELTFYRVHQYRKHEVTIHTQNSRYKSHKVVQIYKFYRKIRPGDSYTSKQRTPFTQCYFFCPKIHQRNCNLDVKGTYLKACRILPEL